MLHRTCLAFALCAAAPAAAQSFAAIDVSDGKPHRIAHDGVQVVLTPVRDPGSDEEAPLVTVDVQVRIPGYATATIEESEPRGSAFPRQVAIGKLSKRDRAPSVIFQSYTGGAHCCAEITALVPVGGKLVPVDVGTFDGGGIDRFPKDVDGDGTADFVVRDDRFDYAFAAYAFSDPPPQVWNVIGGEAVDVSARPAFARLFETAAREARKHCADRSDENRNGACATYVAASARLGRYDAAFREAIAFAAPPDPMFMPTRCSVALADGVCPTGKEVPFKTFAAALRWFLRDAGYVR